MCDLKIAVLFVLAYSSCPSAKSVASKVQNSNRKLVKYLETLETQWFSVAPFAHKGRWRNFHVFGALSLGLNFNISGIFFAHLFCYAVSSCVHDHSHPYLVSECLFLAENKAFPYPRRLRAHPRRLRAILWDAAATCSVVIFVVVAANKRSPNLSVS